MKKILLFGFPLIALVVLFFFFAQERFGWFTAPLAPGVSISQEERQMHPENPEVPFIVEEIVSGLEIPWSIVFTAPKRMLLTERPGRIRVIENGELRSKPLQSFPEVSMTGEEGLMSLTLDPEYAENKFLYVSLAYQVADAMWVQVLRFRDEGDTLTDRTVILDRIPAARYHAGCRLAFGPDGKLYVTTGDATDRNLAQDLHSLAGKILRINSDGSIPNDNPFPESPIWSYGHRNPQGIDWHPETGEMYETEHGPSVFDGPAGGDEVNHIVAGGNYGWPLVSHLKTREGTITPLQVFIPAEAPGSLLVYSGKMLPQFAGDLFFGALNGEGLMRLTLDPENLDRIIAFEKMEAVQFGRIREVMEGPDGAIYFTTSNRDGRGDVRTGDDRIFRIREKEES